MYFKAASCLALGCAMLISPSQAQRPDVATNRAESDNGALRVEPVTTVIAVGIVTALATDMIKGIADIVRGDVRAQVQVHAKTDGPDTVNDHAENADSDISNLWFEYYLDAYTGVVKALNGHVAWAGLYYYYDDGAWRPNPNGGHSSSFWNSFAYANSYKSARLTAPGKTEAAGIGAFAINGNAPKTFSRTPFGVSQGQPAGRGKDAGRGVEENWYVEAESLANIAFSPERFNFIPNSPTTVIARPIGFTDDDGNFLGFRMDLFHSVSMIGEPAPIIPSFKGLNDSIDEQIDDIAGEILANSDGNAVYEPDATDPVDLTITGAALELHQVVLTSVDGAGEPLAPYELLVAYFDHGDAWDIVAPSRAQDGYVPDVLYTGVSAYGRRGGQDTLPPNLAELVPDPVHGGTLESGVRIPETPLVSLVVAVTGTLEDAVSLGANTPGHQVEQITSGLAVGDTFELDTWFSATSSNVEESAGLATPICPTDTDMNGQTDVSDLLNTLSDWGSSCEAECTGDTNDDGTVDIQDLLGIIGSWGNCPVPTGACCSGSDCFDNATEEFCNATGGEFKGSDTFCEYECFITGGCCLSNTCLNEWTEEACLDSAGTWLGQDVPCTDGSCPAPLGMCCQGGSCWQETEQECIALSGSWYGSDADCSMMVCDARSCCIDESTCVMLDVTACEYYGGTSGAADEFCDTTTCISTPPGACCFGDTCDDYYYAEECAYAGGTYQGDDTACGTVACASPPCAADELLDCFGNCFPAFWIGDGICDNGSYSWNGVSIYLNCEEFSCDLGDCDPSLCGEYSGACCLTSTCIEDTTEEDCQMQGGMFFPGATCDDAYCLDGQFGACCTEWGGCFEGIGPEDCKYMGGWFLGVGSTCISCQ